MQPGQTITPGGAQEPPAWQFNPESAQQPATLPQPVAQAESAPQSAQATPSPAPQPAQPVQAAPQPSSAPATRADGSGVNWTASEFIAHDKNGGWYGLLAAGALVLAAAIFLLTRDKMSSAVVVVVAIIFGISAARKPRELEYLVDEHGIRIATKDYPYATFRSFSIVQEGEVESIWLMPLRRFMPIVSIYFDPNDGEKIVDILSQFLPIEDRQPDAVDRLMHRIRF